MTTQNPSSGLALALLASLAFCDAAAAASRNDITVQASRILTKEVGRTYSGIPLKEVWVTARVSTAGLDLASAAGVSGMEQRINAAASSACHEISRRYPLTEGSDLQCAKSAARPALAQVREAALQAHARTTPPA